MEELLKAKGTLENLKKSYEEESGFVKEGYNRRWQQVVSDIGILESALEIISLIKTD